MKLKRTFNAGYDNLYLSKDDVERLLKGQMIKESSLIVQMEKPEHEWVDLTQKEVETISANAQGVVWAILMTQATLKEKNA